MIGLNIVQGWNCLERDERKTLRQKSCWMMYVVT